MASSSSQRLMDAWRRCERLPFGRWLFARVLAGAVPYSASIAPRVLELSPGACRVAMRDRRGVRNHLNSVHAVALANLGELASGLAMNSALPTDVRAIVTGFEVEFRKKARGTITAESRVVLPPVTSDVEHVVVADLKDEQGDVVTTVRVRWKLGPRPAKA